MGELIVDRPEPVGPAWSTMAFSNSINSCAFLLMEAGGENWGVPFASITWSRFNGSAALPRSTLSLRAESSSATGWLPCNVLTLGWASRRVKLGLHFNPRSLHPKSDSSRFFRDAKPACWVAFRAIQASAIWLMASRLPSSSQLTRLGHLLKPLGESGIALGLFFLFASLLSSGRTFVFSHARS